MSETKFTPKPWTLADVERGKMVLGGAGRSYVASVTIEQIGGGAIAAAMEPQRLANADLIAAAPDLYAALTELLFDAFEDAHPDSVKAARAALAKARGETS
jgi:hypothetical protein